MKAAHMDAVFAIQMVVDAHHIGQVLCPVRSDMSLYQRFKVLLACQ